MSGPWRLAAGLMAAAAAFGTLVLLLMALIQLDGDTCGFLAERECGPEELRFNFDAALTLTGLALSAGAAVCGTWCALTGRRSLWWLTLITFAGAALAGLALEILDIPNR